MTDGQHHEETALAAHFTFPKVTSLLEDFAVHDLAMVDILSGTFVPAGPQVMIDVDACYAFMGWARAALLLYVGQPETPGAVLYDSGGRPVEGAQVYPAGSLNGEAAWGETTHRRLVLEVEPRKPVTWQLVPAIIGASAVVPVPEPHLMVITPDGTKAFVTSPTQETVTPIVLGRPGYSYDQSLKTMDAEQAPVRLAGSPTSLSSDDRHVVVSCVDTDSHHLSILSAATFEILRTVTIPGGMPLGSAVTPDGQHALVGTGAGRLARVELATGAVDAVDLGGRIRTVGVLPDGTAAYTADAENRMLYQVALPSLTVEAKIPLDYRPHLVRVAPDGQVWVLCRPPAAEMGRLLQVDPARNQVVADYVLPFAEPADMAIVPVAGQTVETVRTVWVTYQQGRFSEFYIGGAFTGETHSIHHGTMTDGGDVASSVAVNDYGEIWVVQPDLDRVWKWPGGRFSCRADRSRLMNGAFFGEYCDVSVYGALSAEQA